MYPQTEGKKVRLYTGSYNAPVLTGDGAIYHGKGRGIQVFLFDEAEGSLEASESYPEVENASWLAFSPDWRTLYAVNELDDYEGTGGGALSALAVGEDGGLTLRGRLPVMAAAPCHVDCCGSGGHVFTANYSGGSLSSFAVNEDGGLKEMDLRIIHRLESRRPQGIDERRQEKPHVHSTAVFRGHLWVTDLGLDEISVYKLDETGRIVGSLAEASPLARGKGLSMATGSAGDDPPTAFYRVTLPAGSGPRSLAFREDDVYVSCELSDQIGILRWDGERIEVKGFVPCTPGEEAEASEKVADREAEAPGEAAAAREESGARNGNRKRNFPGGVLLSSDGRYLYAGNRGHDSIVVYKVEHSGMPKSIQWIASGGRTPRGFQLSPSGRWLIAANQDSDNLVVFRRNRETGMLTEHVRYEAGAVVCLAFL